MNMQIPPPVHGRSWSATGRWVPVEAGAEASLDDDIGGSSSGGSVAARPSLTPSSDTGDLDSVALVSITSTWSVTFESELIGGVSVRVFLSGGGKLLWGVSLDCEICLHLNVSSSEFVPLLARCLLVLFSIWWSWLATRAWTVSSGLIALIILMGHGGRLGGIGSKESITAWNHYSQWEKLSFFTYELLWDQIKCSRT